MRIFKTKKSKVLMICLAVILIASILCVSLVGCKKQMYGDTPIGVYFVGDFQRNVDATTLKAITKDKEEIVSIESALAAAKIDANADPVAAAAAIYAVAVTNYNNITQTGYYILTDAKVNAKKVSSLAFKDITVGIRSTYSSFDGKKGHFAQTVSGVTQLSGVGSIGDKIKTAFGYCDQNFDNKDFSASRKGKAGGAQFPTEKNIGKDVYKYILGAYNNSLTNQKSGNKVGFTAVVNAKKEDPIPDYVQPKGAQYPSKSTLEGIALPSFNAERNAWDKLNRIPARIWKNGKIEEDGATVEGTRYSYGTYGAGWAVYDFSRPEYLSSETKVTHNDNLGLWTIEVKVKDEFVQQACEFAAGDLVKSTKDYIGLKNAKYTEASCKFEVYDNGLIKSMQKRDVLTSTEKCPLNVLTGDCQNGGTTSNTATMAFSYSDYDTDVYRLAALYWPELGTTDFFNDNKDGKKKYPQYKLDLSAYPTFSEYKPVVNESLAKEFVDLFAPTNKK